MRHTAVSTAERESIMMGHQYSRNILIGRQHYWYITMGRHDNRNIMTGRHGTSDETSWQSEHYDGTS